MGRRLVHREVATIKRKVGAGFSAETPVSTISDKSALVAYPAEFFEEMEKDDTNCWMNNVK